MGPRDRILCPCAHDTSTYYLGQETWEVGPRYRLEKYLGSGSFSSVCSATDTETGELVALKKIPNVNSNLENARIVLREVCILRRLCHPHIIELHDAFWKPSPTGKMMLVNGMLQRTGIDVYIVMENCGGGDLHELRGQLTRSQVKSLMHQLLTAVRYMHGLNVWHRDLKSANVLLTVHEGQHIAKIADLGSARSGACCGKQGRSTLDSLVSTPSGVSMKATSEVKRHAGQSEMDRTLTRRVCTPCYRAPEVVLSRGRYSSAMDMWSLGCIFGELLQRMEHTGASFTPNLFVTPVFQFSTWSPNTPSPGLALKDADDALAGRELKSLFEVIGTPEWACIEAVESERWRDFLRGLPAKAPHLMRRFGAAGEPTVDLLRRLLAFDPKRRCSAEEALSHEYFRDTNNPGDITVHCRSGMAPCDAEMRTPFECDNMAPSVTPPEVSRVGCSDGVPLTGGAQRDAARANSVPMAAYNRRLSRCETGLRLAEPAGGLGGNVGMWPAGQAAAIPDDKPAGALYKRSRSLTGDVADGSEMRNGDMSNGEARDQPQSLQHYFDIVEPAAALEALEVELDRLLDEIGMPAKSAARDGVACSAVCMLIKQECDAEAERQQVLRTHRPPQTTASAPGEGSNFQRRWWGRKQPLEPDPRNTTAVALVTPSSPSQANRLRRLSLEDSGGSGLLRVSGSPRFSSSGRAEGAPMPCPEEQLKPGRHDEWSLTTGHDLTAPEGPVWGGGMGGMDVDEETQKVISRQQVR